jgi:hypothetical protein
VFALLARTLVAMDVLNVVAGVRGDRTPACCSDPALDGGLGARGVAGGRRCGGAVIALAFVVEVLG